MIKAIPITHGHPIIAKIIFIKNKNPIIPSLKRKKESVSERISMKFSI
jgi:hypothetical protein